MTPLETGLIITSVGLLFIAWRFAWLAVDFKKRKEGQAQKAELYMMRLSKSELKVDYLKSMNAKFIKLNNNLLDQMDEMVDRRKFNGTKHKQR